MSKLKKVAVIIPFYRETVFEYEAIALQQCEKILASYDKIAIKPRHLTLPAGADQCTFADVVSFDDSFFDGIQGYNALMLSAQFYEAFLAYEFILIYQLDAFVFKDDLSYWCAQKYDYIGAPWLREFDFPDVFKAAKSKIQYQLHTRFNIKRNGVPSLMQYENKVGNGGFSLRRVKKFYDLCFKMRAEMDVYTNRKEALYHEDMFWSVAVNRKTKQLEIPSYKIGLKFSMEIYPERAFQINHQQLPFGCHAWDKHADFWRPIFAGFGYNI